MSEEELNRYYKLKKEVEDLTERLAKLGYGVGSISITDEPKNKSHTNKSIQERITELIETWIETRLSAIESFIKIESYIRDIEDPEIRTIARLRYLDNHSWDSIADKMSTDTKILSSDAVRKKLRRYLEKNEKKDVLSGMSEKKVLL